MSFLCLWRPIGVEIPRPDPLTVGPVVRAQGDRVPKVSEHLKSNESAMASQEAASGAVSCGVTDSTAKAGSHA